MRVILASGSPRRKELLAKVVPSFEVVVPDVEEGHEDINDPEERAAAIARDKASAVSQTFEDAIVIAADTIVAFEADGQFVHLGKPVDESDARRMLRLLSGRTHVVVTGVDLHGSLNHTVIPGFSAGSFAVKTSVTFRHLEPDEIEAYVATGEPMDKAGAYAIQGGAAAFASAIEGSLDNVIGLPTEALQLVLPHFSSHLEQRNGCNIFRRFS